MKFKFTLIVAAICLLFNIQAQVPPNAFNYSAVARDAQSNPITNQTIGIQISILKNNSFGQVKYAENHFINTDQFGLFNLIIGSGAIQSGNMSDIEWNTDNFFLKVGMDASGGVNFLTMGITQLLSVPYALHSATADSVIGGNNTINETDPIFESSVAFSITSEDTSNWNSPNELQTLSISNDTIYLSNSNYAVLNSETDPIFENSVASGITQEDTSNWNNSGELQTLSISNDTIFLTNGSFVKLPNVSGGKTYVQLFDNVTDAEADSILANDFGPNTQFVYITNTTNLTTVDLSGISSLFELKIESNNALTSINGTSSITRISQTFTAMNNPLLEGLNFDNLEKLGDFDYDGNSQISAINLPNLIYAANISVRNSMLSSVSLSALESIRNISFEDNTELSSINLSALETCDQITAYANIALTNLVLSSLQSSQSLSINNNSALTNLDLSALQSSQNLEINSNSALNNLDLSALQSSQSLSISSNSALTNLDLSALESSQSLAIYSNSALNSIDLSALQSSQSLSISSNSALTSIDLSSLQSFSNFYLNENALQSSEINEILAMLVGLGSSFWGNFYDCIILGQNPSAPPVGQGITDLNTLQNWGVCVLTN